MDYFRLARYNRGWFYVRRGSSKMTNTTIHWARILLGGLLAEVALIVAIAPLGLRLGENFLHYTAVLRKNSIQRFSTQCNIVTC